MNKKILIVDDEPDLVKVSTLLLEKQGFSTTSAMNGSEALTAAKRGDIGLVLLDYYLPDMTGLDVFNALRSDEKTKDIPIIFISASQEMIESIPVQENMDKLVKPISMDKLLAGINKLT